MVHALTIHFSQLLQEIQPPKHRRDKAVELTPKVQDYLRRHEEFDTKSPHSRQVGSYAQHLSVGDVKDVDFLIRVDVDHEDDDTAREVLKALKDALDDLPEYLGYIGDTYFDINRNRRSVHVGFEQEDFHFDVVPCVAPNGFEESIFVPDWGFKAWVPSNPLGVVQLVEDLEKDHQGKFRGLAKLLKHFRNTHMIYMKPKSYWMVAMTIEAVAGGNIDTSQPLALAFDELLHYLYDEYSPALQRAGSVPEVPDPMLGHDVAHSWKRHDFERFMDVLKENKGRTARAVTTDNKDTAVELWQKVLGPEFPTTVDDFAKSYASAGQPGSSYARPTGLIVPAAGASGGIAVPRTRYYGGDEG